MKLEYRQGDVGMDRINTIPEEAKIQKKGRIVLAEGEVTGHCHEVATEDLDHVTLYELDGKFYLSVKEMPAIITHQEHAPITLPVGNYEVVPQREYTPEEVRRVQD